VRRFTLYKELAFIRNMNVWKK